MDAGAGRDDPGKLAEYERKRDFSKTSEPRSKRRAGKASKAPRFVVQEHSARRLHWDLRLERDGVAASWAVPNGIPDDPAENHKAIQTEDHPLEYLEFEGEIPAGEYGAGTMRVWDRGTYECEKWEPGKVILVFQGERLTGRYALFRAGRAERDWMIHRMDPPAAARDPFPGQVEPMLATTVETPPKGDGWAVEVGWAGVRAIAHCRPGRIELRDADGAEVTGRYPELRRLARELGMRDAVLDGCVVAFDSDGRPSRERLAERAKVTSDSAIRRRVKTHPVTYVIFDLLYLDGADLTGEPYSRRRELLDSLGLDGESWQAPAYSTSDPADLLAAGARQGLEALVCKRLDSVYEPGVRTDAWLRIAVPGGES